MHRLAEYRTPNDRRALFQIVATALPLSVLWILSWVALQYSVWLCLLMAIPTAGFLVRLFIIQHDCGHGSLFSSRRANDWVGRVISVFTVTPYDFWRRTHAIHHASSGNLDHRGAGDIQTLTVAEYQALGRLRRALYWLYRHPIVMFGVSPFFLFVLQQRLPVGGMRGGMMPWLSTMLTNVAIAGLVVLFVCLIGWKAVLAVHLPAVSLAASLGVWLFYLQHQFENTFWEKPPSWTHEDAALHGSSYYDLPKPLMWLTGYIGAHHLHHLSSRIPFYNLPIVLKDYPEFKNIGRLTFFDSLNCVRLTLWCEAEKRLISFRELRERTA
jgi:acyl-lipid omega-6 desaturase (Delta-12 desaturase)